MFFLYSAGMRTIWKALNQFALMSSQAISHMWMLTLFLIFQGLYFVHISALISLFQINTDICIHILLNHHFINTLRTPCFNPYKVIFREYNGYISVTWVTSCKIEIRVYHVMCYTAVVWVCTGFGWTKWHWDSPPPLQVSFHHCSILSFIHLSLTLYNLSNWHT